MGQHADDILNGVVCAICGEFFADWQENIYEHGFPVACVACWEEGCGYEKQDEEAHILSL